MESNVLIEIMVMSLAVWRISNIITKEEFAFGLARRFRLLCGVKESMMIDTVTIGYDEDGYAINKDIAHYVPIPSYLQSTLLARGVTCMWCMSFWIAVLFSIGYIAYYGEISILTLSMPFVLSALAIGYDELLNKG